MRITEKEFQNLYKVHILGVSDIVGKFDCEDVDLNDFLANEALPYQEAKIAVTYVVENNQNGTPMAYFSLANDKVSLTDFKSNSEFNRFRKRKFVHSKRLRSYPAVKLCRLGIDKHIRKMGMGSYLLQCIKTLFSLNARTGCRFITVDAYREAVPFYEKNGFLPLTSQDTDLLTERMYYDLCSNYQ